MTLDDLEASLARGEFQPVYLVLGPEEYLSREAVRLIAEKAVEPGAAPFNSAEFSARTDPAQKAVNAARTFPVMSPRRLVLWNDAEATPEDGREELLTYAQSPETRTVLVLSARDLDRRTTFYRGLKQSACTLEFAPLKGSSLADWAGRYIRSRGYKISPNSLGNLVELTGSDLRVLSMEADKLMLYAGADRIVTDTAVTELVRGSRQHRVFDLTDALGRRETATALRILGRLMEAGESPLAIVGMLARHFRQILLAKELLDRGVETGEISRAAAIPPFVLRELLRQARSMKTAEAARIYIRLAAVDYRFKSSSVDQRLVLENLILSMSM